MDREPVLIVLGGLGTIISLALVATNVLGWTDLDPSQVAAIIALVAAITGLVSALLRGEVWSIDSHEDEVVRALYSPAPLRSPDEGTA